MDYDKAKRALDALSQERQAQKDRLKKATEAKARLSSSFFLRKASSYRDAERSFSYEVNLTAQAKQQLDASRTQLPNVSRVL